jgi:hypothetical protein
METMVAPSGDQEGFKDQVTVNKFGNWKAVECQKITEHDIDMYNDIYIYIYVCVFVLSIAVFHLAIDNPHLKVSIQIMDCPVIIIELQNMPFPVHSTHPINQT